MTEPAEGSDPAPASRASLRVAPGVRIPLDRADLAVLGVGRAREVSTSTRRTRGPRSASTPPRRPACPPGPGSASSSPAGARRHGGSQRRALAGPQPGARPGPPGCPAGPGAGGGPAPKADPSDRGVAAPAGGGQAPAGSAQAAAPGSGLMSTTAEASTTVEPVRPGPPRLSAVQTGSGMPSTWRVVATSRSIWATRSPTDSKRDWPRRWATNSTRAVSP